MTERKKPYIFTLRSALTEAIKQGDAEAAAELTRALIEATAKRRPHGPKDPHSAKRLRAVRSNAGSKSPKVHVSLTGWGIEVGDYVTVTREPGRIVLTPEPKGEPDAG